MTAKEYNKSLGLNQSFRSDQDHVFEFAEAYLKTKVESVTDEIIEDEFKYGFAHYYQEGAKWFKNELLKH